MSSGPPPSQPPPPSGGNGMYIAVAILLLLGIGGIIVWKLSDKTPPAPPPVASTAPSVASSSPISTSIIDEVPLPPPVIDAGPAPTTTIVQSGGGDPCAASACYGNVAPGSDAERGLQLLAHQTRRKCYDPALANDPTLQGHVTVRMKIASNGQICSANVAKNDMPSTSVGECAARMLLASGRVPAPKGGCVELNFPLNYVPMGQH
ncbi:MAG TPA: AgmX/PglI C-terminal domain-containing protein [Polyangiaceae bacterium]|jgi:outer membrane biosynthesis protein TonB